MGFLSYIIGFSLVRIIWGIFFRKKYLFTILIITAFLYFVPSYMINFYISEIVGTDVRAELSYPELLRGNIYFKKLEIDNPQRMGIVRNPAIVFYRLKINVNVWSFMWGKHIINSIKISAMHINYINNIITGNNISKIADNMNKNWLQTHEPSSFNKYLVKEVHVGSITRTSYYYVGIPVNSESEPILFKDINTEGTLEYVVVSALYNTIKFILA